ncbi:MAG: hypothetical protein ACJARS_004936 [bacterium]
MCLSCGLFRFTDLAGKVPIVNAFGQGFTAFTLDILANKILQSRECLGRLVTGFCKRESLAHGEVLLKTVHSADARVHPTRIEHGCTNTNEQACVDGALGHARERPAASSRLTVEILVP